MSFIFVAILSVALVRLAIVYTYPKRIIWADDRNADE